MTNQVMMDCDNCGKKTMHIQPSTSHLLHLVLSVITFGVWLIVWIIIALNNKTQGHCVECGREVGVLGSTRGGNKVANPTPEMFVKCPDCRELVLKEARKCKHCGCNLIISVSEYARSKGISEEQVMEMIRDRRLYAVKTSGGIVVHLNRVE